MTLAERHHLDDVLADLVAHHVLSEDQAHAVVDAWGPEPEASAAAAAAPVAPVAVTAPAAPAPAAVPVGAPSTVRARLVEAAAYLGALLVGGALVAFLADSWEGYTLATRTALLASIGVVAGVAGVVVAFAVGGGRGVLHEAHAAPRRRLASVLMSLGSVLVAVSIPVWYDGTIESGVAAGLVALGLLVAAHLVASSAVTELGMVAASGVVLTTGFQWLAPERPYFDYVDGTYPPVWGWDLVRAGAFMALGLGWAGLVSRVLTLPVVAEVVGLLIALQAALGLALDQPSRWYGLGALLLLAVLGVGGFILRRTWPWLAATVLAVTASAFVLASESDNPALPFLVSGLVLLATAGAGAYLGRRRRAPVT